MRKVIRSELQTSVTTKPASRRHLIGRLEHASFLALAACHRASEHLGATLAHLHSTKRVQAALEANSEPGLDHHNRDYAQALAEWHTLWDMHAPCHIAHLRDLAQQLLDATSDYEKSADP